MTKHQRRIGTACMLLVLAGCDITVQAGALDGGNDGGPIDAGSSDGGAIFHFDLDGAAVDYSKHAFAGEGTVNTGNGRYFTVSGFAGPVSSITLFLAHPVVVGTHTCMPAGPELPQVQFWDDGGTNSSADFTVAMSSCTIVVTRFSPPGSIAGTFSASIGSGPALSHQLTNGSFSVP